MQDIYLIPEIPTRNPLSVSLIFHQVMKMVPVDFPSMVTVSVVTS